MAPRRGLNNAMKPVWMLGSRGVGVGLFPSLFPILLEASCPDGTHSKCERVVQRGMSTVPQVSGNVEMMSRH